MIVDDIFDRLLEFARPKAFLIPPMDGSMRLNNLLDESPIIVEVHRPDNATDINGELWFSSQNRLLKFNPSDEHSEPQIVREFDEEISCMAGSSDGILQSDSTTARSSWEEQDSPIAIRRWATRRSNVRRH